MGIMLRPRVLQPPWLDARPALEGALMTGFAFTAGRIRRDWLMMGLDPCYPFAAFFTRETHCRQAA